jgi:hypothetical protein
MNHWMNWYDVVACPRATLISVPSTSRVCVERESVLFIGTQFSILYTSMYSQAEAATPRA